MTFEEAYTESQCTSTWSLIKVSGKTVCVLRPFVYKPTKGSPLNLFCSHGLQSFKTGVKITTLWSTVADKLQPSGVALLANNKPIYKNGEPCAFT